MAAADPNDRADATLGADASDEARLDMGDLIASARAALASAEGNRTSWTIDDLDFDELARKTGFAERRKGKPEMVLASDTAVELGHPTTASRVLLLTTTRRELVNPHAVTRIGPDFDQSPPGERRPIAQVVLVALRPGANPDPFELDSAQFLINRLPGYMVRSIPGRLWVRVSKRAVAAGLALDTVARALCCAYERDFDEVDAVEVLFVTSSAADVEALAPVVLEADVIRGRHKKLAISPDGDLDCNELTCDTCEEQPVCDDLREIVRERKRRRTR